MTKRSAPLVIVKKEGGEKIGKSFYRDLFRIVRGSASDRRMRYEIDHLDLTRQPQLFLGKKLVGVIHKLKWESKVFRQACWNAHLAIPVDDKIGLQLIARSLKQPGMTWTRVAREHRRVIRVLSQEGFEPIIKMINFECALSSALVHGLRQNHEIREGKARDTSPLSQLARHMFSQDRFHSDRRISSRFADQAHVEWIRNSALGKLSSKTLVSITNGEISGFHVWKVVNTPRGLVGMTVLIGVAKKFAGKGIGKSLLASGLQAMWQAGARKAWVRTEAANSTANHLYASFGFQKSHCFWYLRKFNP